MDIKWWVYEATCEYEGTANGMDVWDEDQLSTKFTVSADAGDYFNVILQVRDEAEHPMEVMLK